MRRLIWGLIGVLVLLGGFGQALTAQDGDDADFEELLELLQEDVTISSRVASSEGEAPGIVTVITAKQIRDMGARSLLDVLQIVPGFNVLPYNIEGFPFEMYYVRGIVNYTNANVLVLHNGARMNEFFSGSTWVTEHIIFLENIERIEIIRGPGSALYGANAFTAVINLITTAPQKLNGVQVGAEGSSFEGQRYHLLAGKQFDSWSASFFAQYYQNGGQQSVVPATEWQRIGGEIQDKHMQAIDLEAQFAYKGFKLDMRYLRRKPHSFYTSLTANPPDDDDLHYLSDSLSVYGTYQHSFLDERLRLDASLEYKHIDMMYQIVLVNYPQQIHSSAYSDDMAGELSLSYDLFAGNTISGGLRLGQERFWDSISELNFIPPSSNLVDWFEIPLYPEADRQIVGAYLEDVWNIGEKVSMTVGGRVDHYDEFGSSINPRFALVYTPIPDLALKALYGGAFRAPSLIEKADAELDLEAEDLRTYELGISYNLPKIVTIQGNYFYTTINNLIDPDVRENVGEFLTQGVEFELKGSYKGHYGWVNYTYNNAEDVQTGLSIYGMTPHTASAGLSLSAFERVNLSVWGYLRGERKMETTDGKDTLEGYAQFNTTLRVNNLFTEGLEGYVSVYNLFDTDYEYPIREFMAISARGREGLLGIRYTF